MALNNDQSIECLALKLMDYSLPKHDWSHRSHFAVALWLLRHRPELTAPDEIKRLISGYNEATHTPNTESSGYHHTITLASLRAATHYLEIHPSTTPVHVVLQSLMMSECGRSDWLLSYWSPKVLFSPVARRQWVAPDLSAMPF